MSIPPGPPYHVTILEHAMYSDTQNTYIHKNESKHSEMGPVRQNQIQRTVRSVCMCVGCVHCTVHNSCTQYCTEQTLYFSLLAPHNHHCSDDVYLREGALYPKTSSAIHRVTIEVTPQFKSV